jgi:hypothetical protein
LVDDSNDSISTHSGLVEYSGQNGLERFHGDQDMLIHESCIEFGRFAYAALQPISVRSSPTVSEASRTSIILQRGDICLATVLIHSYAPSSNSDGTPADGPFLYLPTLGWVFEHKQNRVIMQRLFVEEGYWSLQVLRRLEACNGPVLNGGRASYISRYLLTEEGDDSVAFFDSGSQLLSDACVISPLNGATFYRVRDQPQKWICKRNESDGQLNVVRAQPPAPLIEKKQVTFSVHTPSEKRNVRDSTEKETSVQDGWTEDFVKGVASLMEGLTPELRQSEPGKLVFMKNKAKIQIECNARFVTVHVTDQRLVRFPKCTSKQLSSILDDPLQATQAQERDHIKTGPPPPIRLAGELSVLSTKNQMLPISSTKNVLQSQLRDVEQQLAHQETRKRELQLSLQLLEKGEIPSHIGPSIVVPPLGLSGIASFDGYAGSLTSTDGSRTASQGSTGSMDSSSRTTLASPMVASEVNLVCGACFKEFNYPRERRKHCLDVHGLYSCNFCTAVFDSRKKLHAHRDERDHW